MILHNLSTAILRRVVSVPKIIRNVDMYISATQVRITGMCERGDI